MDPLIIGLVAASALLHVAWNVRLKTAGDPLRTATIGLDRRVVRDPADLDRRVAGIRVAVALAAGIAFGLASGVFEAAYFVLLAEAYRRGDLSVVYPLARGTAPLLLVAIGVVLLGERLGTAGWVGVACLLAGFLALQRPWQALQARADGRRPDAAIAFAIATGIMIACYTSLDRLGTREMDPFIYASILWIRRDPPRDLGRGRGGWGTVVRRPGAEPPGGRGWRPDAGRVRAHPLRPQRRPVDGGRAAAGIGDGHRRDLGAVRLGEATSRGDATRRIGASAVIVLGALLLALDG